MALTVIHFNPCNPALYLQTTAFVLLYRIFFMQLIELYIWWHLAITWK